MRVGLAQEAESQGEQTVTGENRRRLVERLVNGWLAPSQIVVVHGGQVVMDQRIRMYAFDCGGHPAKRPAIDSEDAPALLHQKCTEPLAAAQCRIAHGFE